MEPNKNLLMNKAIMWGLFTAIASICVTLIFWATGNMFSPFASWVSIFVYIGGIVLATRSYTKEAGEGAPFPYAKALGLGVATLFFASIILAVFNYVLYSFIDPGLLDKMFQMAEDSLLQSGFSEDMVEQQVSMQRKFMTPILMSISGIFSVTFYGLIIALVTSIFLRKKEANGFEGAMKEIDDDDE